MEQYSSRRKRRRGDGDGGGGGAEEENEHKAISKAGGGKGFAVARRLYSRGRGIPIAFIEGWGCSDLG